MNWLPIQVFVIPQSHHTPSMGCSRAVLNKNRTSTHGGPYEPSAAPYEFHLPIQGPQSFNACIISLRALYRFRNHKQPVNSLCGDRNVGPVWPHTMPMRDFHKFWLCQFPYVSVKLPCPTRALYGSCRVWKTLQIPVWGLYKAHKGITWCPCGVLWIIRSNHKCTAFSSRMGPIAWCDHEDSTGVKFLQVVHSSLTGKKSYGC